MPLSFKNRFSWGKLFSIRANKLSMLLFFQLGNLNLLKFTYFSNWSNSGVPRVWKILNNCPISVFPRNSGRPSSISATMQPTLHMSTLVEYMLSPINISGHLYHIVITSGLNCRRGNEFTLTSAKSAIFSLYSLFGSVCSTKCIGFKFRCITPCLCIA